MPTCNIVFSKGEEFLRINYVNLMNNSIDLYKICYTSPVNQAGQI